MSKPLTLIGLGPMGRAMVAKFLEHGHPVTVWNRTASRADEVVAKGARRADTPRDAVAANGLIVLSLTDYAAMYDVLNGVPVAGKTIVNLSSDTPDKTLKAAAWLAERGAELVVGGVMVPPPVVGTEAAYVFYSGPSAVFEEHREALAVLGRTEYLGEDHSLAQLYYQAQLDFFLTALSGVLHSVALVKSAGISGAEFLPHLRDNVGGLVEYLDMTVDAIDRGEHPGDLSNIIMMSASADHVVGASEDAGVDAGLPKAVQGMYRKGLAAGFGRDNWTALYEVIKAGR
ncbi:NAD(P)-dependent oxidoreductase [Saccharothrix obliqua]|uniref:NAD(P)-dependent oxidoreductase n=1 Tax=Saccharothrix obliqua TaxID=2861747 RepID=UPI001C5EF846|nr:NAD(P)-binding domain-containing protein [Saccharothrix obliqua]MBW4716028.1 NAD(P)-binding domain-containing protein [Saccharothrix obliqua]